MNKKTAGIISIVIIFACIAYIIYDIATGRSDRTTAAGELIEKQELLTKWQITNELQITDGRLQAVSLAGSDNIICGGDSFLAMYNSTYEQLWNTNTPAAITALAASGDTIYAATMETILLYDISGKLIDEWGPYDDEAIITSIATNSKYIALADAGNKVVFILDRKGALESVMGY
ncbi:MAG: PQQ-binding-like beta-propeller repeat protein, partial [Bacteroidales bacterium]|nr:PQQ-binding-like beta-propeller repeat protein [Bacteroidales bacterium]